MPIALDQSNKRIEGGSSELIRPLSYNSNFDSLENQRLESNNNQRMAGVEERKDFDSCSSSSIGRNSDSSGRLSDGDDEDEVQSSYKGPLDTMDVLEDVLPIRRGISKFYNGKSKSYTSLTDASVSSSIKDLAKPDNAYTRKRKNLLACNNFVWDKNPNKNPAPPTNDAKFGIGGGGGGISSKKATNSIRRSTFPITTETNSSSESNNGSENSNCSLSPPLGLRPPLHPPSKSSMNIESSSPPTPPPRRNTSSSFSAWRSFSLTDLQCAAAADARNDSERTRPNASSSSKANTNSNRYEPRGLY